MPLYFCVIGGVLLGTLIKDLHGIFNMCDIPTICALCSDMHGISRFVVQA